MAVQTHLLTDADRLRLTRHAQIIKRIAKWLLDTGSVRVKYVQNGKKLMPLNSSHADQLVRGQIGETDEFLRREHGQIEWTLDPLCHPFDPDDPTAVWLYSNSGFRLHQNDPFTEADVASIIKEVASMKDVAPEVCENLIRIFSMCMQITLGIIHAPKTWMVSVRPTKVSRNIECLGYCGDYWYNGLCTLRAKESNSHIVVSFTPYLDADNKRIPDEMDNPLSISHRN